jgi:NTE family protein
MTEGTGSAAVTPEGSHRVRAATPPGPPGRVGLVLGAGGILGAAWLIGALHALAEETGWEPGTAEHVVGTSAGSVVGSLIASGIPTWFLLYHQRGGQVDGMVDRYGQPLESPEEVDGRLFTWTRRLPRLLLGSPELAVRTALQPWRFPPTAALVGWIGRGFFSNDEVGRMVRTVVAKGWSDHPNLWIVAVDYRTGRRMVFGAPDAPPTDLWRAVQASCAIPGFYRPVEIAGREYIDGGAWSPSNVDLLAHEPLDAVIAFNPMSTLHPGVPTTILERAERRYRGLTGRRLGREVKRLVDAGMTPLLVQPTEDDLAAMGINLMDPARRLDVLETAVHTTKRRLREPDAQPVLDLLRRRALLAGAG